MPCSWWPNPATIINILLVMFTGALVIVGYLQRETLEKTDETSRLRDRAFVYFLDPTFRPYPPDKPTDWGIVINVVNMGNMPARRISIRFSYIYSQKSENIIDPYPSAEWSNAEVPNFIGPKQSFSLQGGAIPIRQIEEAQKSKINIYIMMEAEYIDGFELNKSRVTQMSRILRFDQHGGRSLGFAGPHNCTDDDCGKISRK